MNQNELRAAINRATSSYFKVDEMETKAKIAREQHQKSLLAVRDAVVDLIADPVEGWEEHERPPLKLKDGIYFGKQPVLVGDTIIDVVISDNTKQYSGLFGQRSACISVAEAKTVLGGDDTVAKALNTVCESDFIF